MEHRKTVFVQRTNAMGGIASGVGTCPARLLEHAHDAEANPGHVCSLRNLYIIKVSRTIGGSERRPAAYIMFPISNAVFSGWTPQKPWS